MALGGLNSPPEMVKFKKLMANFQQFELFMFTPGMTTFYVSSIRISLSCLQK